MAEDRAAGRKDWSSAGGSGLTGVDAPTPVGSVCRQQASRCRFYRADIHTLCRLISAVNRKMIQVSHFTKPRKAKEAFAQVCLVEKGGLVWEGACSQETGQVYRSRGQSIRTGRVRPEGRDLLIRDQVTRGMGRPPRERSAPFRSLATVGLHERRAVHPVVTRMVRRLIPTKRFNLGRRLHVSLGRSGIRVVAKTHPVSFAVVGRGEAARCILRNPWAGALDLSSTYER